MRKQFYRLLTLCLLLAMLVVAFPVLAQGGPIGYGQAVTGEITNESPEQYYTFEGTAGDTITVSQTAMQLDLDSFLELLGPDGRGLINDDDSGGNLNSLIGPYTLPETGTYTIIATRFGQREGTSVGPYELVVNLSTIVSVTLNETVTVDLNESEPVVYLTYQGTTGQVITVTGIGIAGDTGFTITVTDPQGSFLSQVYGDLRYQGISDPLTLNMDGNYNITIRREQGGQPVAEGVSPAASLSLTVRTVETQALMMGAPASGTLNDGAPVAYYTFEGTEGSLLRLAGSQAEGSGPFEVRILSPFGYSINGANTVYSPTQGSFLLDPLQLDTTGSYLVMVLRFDAEGTGVSGDSAYTITLGETETPMLQMGVEVQGSLSDQVYEQAYTFMGNAGDSVRITLRSVNESYAPSIDIQGPSGGIGSGVGGGGGMGQGPGSFIWNVNSGLPGTVSYEATLQATGLYLCTVRNGLFGDDAQFGLLVELAQ